MSEIPAYNLENLEVVYVEQFRHIRSMVRSVLAELGMRKFATRRAWTKRTT
jgi:hypothetical protein